MLSEKQRMQETGGHLYKFFPDTGPFSWKKYTKHIEFFQAGKIFRERLFMAGNRVGKFHSSNERVLCPSGWRRLGDLVVGDTVLGPNGEVANVTGVYDQGPQQLYRIHFNDGTHVDAGLPHLFKCKGPEERFRKTYEKNGKVWDNPTYGTWKVVPLQDIIDHVGMEPSPRRRYSLPVVGSLCYEDRTFPIDPYTLGVFLGDGGIKRCVQLSTADEEQLELIEWDYDRRNGYDYFFNGKQDLFRQLGLFGKGAEDKFVPDLYKHSNERLAVLQGLMDTDGHVNPKNGACEFISVSEQLAQDVADICRSLGIRCAIKRKQTSWVYKGKKNFNVAYRVNIWNTDIPLFRLERKRAVQEIKRQSKNGTEAVIVKIEPANVEEARCIEIDSEDRTYIVGDYCVTHNTICGTYESACHLTGLYPDWWDGRRFDHPTDGWAAGDTGQTTRDIIQKELLGPPGALGTGMLAKDLIIGVTSRPGIPNAVDSITVKHVSGGTSRLGFKSYDQKRRSFQGTAKHFIHFDEEPPAEVYGEAIIRTMTTNGLIYVTCTPLQGLTAFIQDFMDEAVIETKEEVEDFG